MSSVVIAGNTSGTITLDAPDVAGSTVLTLPATSGSLFTQGNIVGTVSQTGGVPTGAVIESGSNANGFFTKFADGTLICRNAVAFNAGSIIWAVPFSSTNYQTVTTNDTTSIVTTTVLGRTTIDIDFITNATANSINFIAIGRWY